MTYAVWCPFKVAPTREIKEAASTIEVCGYPASMERNMGYHVLVIRGIPSDSDAFELINKLPWSLRWASLQTDIGVDVIETVDKLTRFDEPEKAGKRMGFDHAVDGVFQGNMICAFPEDQSIKKVTAGGVGIMMSAPAEPFVAAVGEGVEVIEPSAVDSRLKLATELFCMSEFEWSPQAKFLSLCIALEVASTRAKVANNVVEQLDEWIAIAKSSLDSDIRDLAGRLNHLKRMSHRQSVRAFVKRALVADSNTQAEEVSAEALHLYDKRGSLVHGGQLEVGQEAPRLKEIVRMTLLSAIRNGL